MMDYNRARKATTFVIFMIASGLPICKAFVAVNLFKVRNNLEFDVSGTVNSRALGVCSIHEQRACHRRHSVASRAMEARNTFQIPMDLQGGEGWGNNLAFFRSRCRKHRTSATTPRSMSNGHRSNEVLNPLSRDDPERARLNNFITILAETPVEEWKPAILDEYLSSLLRGNLYRQAMAERLAKVRSGEEREALTRVDAFLTGYLAQERRKASRKKVSIILTAATEGAAQLDEVIQILGKEDLLDSDLTDYVTSLISGEENKCVQSTLLKVLRTVRDRIKVELETRSRPEIRTLAQALQIDDPRERKKFLQHAFMRLEDLDEFVKFVQEGIEYMGNDYGVSMRSNMPQENFDKMKTIYAEAAAIRRKYLQ